VTFRNTAPISTEVFQDPFNYHHAASNGPNRCPRQSASSRAAYPHLPRESSPLESRRYSRPGKEPTAKFEPEATKLQELCERLGGDAFAVDWILVVFKHGVTKEALIRSLDRNELAELDFPGGFEPRLASDGFLSKIGDRYECGLCKEGKNTYWKYKKDAPRHLRKFHFGLADLCKIWCVRWAFLRRLVEF